MTADQAATAARQHSALGVRELPDGRVLYLVPMLFGWRLCVAADADAWGYEDGYCYHDLDAGRQALRSWDGAGDPFGWVKHLGTGRRRPDG